MDFTQTGKVLQNLVYQIAGPEYKDFVTIAFGWKKLVGNILAERASIHKLEKKVLFVSVTNNVWMQELILRKFQLMEDIKSMLNVQISDIVFFLKQNKVKSKRIRKKNG
ncbi:MAG: DUF721 domain-containing protein [Candidatus Cloacimonetes bacterium]|nr:DUF721 domain-containing protein [Candidatus Cloacimonadota bacterium]